MLVVMPTRRFPGRYESLAKIGDFVLAVAQKLGFSPAQLYAVQLAVDEACTNIIEHGYGGEGRGEIECVCNSSEGSLTVTLRDWGAQFNPDQVPEPDYDRPLEELRPRGAGLFLMRKMMDEVDFKFGTARGNELTMTKFK